MNKITDRTGIKYNRLTAVRFVARFGGNTYWECRCDCGKLHTASASALQSGGTRSCGCLRREMEQAGWRPVLERFWEKVNKHGPIPKHKPELGPCWVWTASKRGGGYGQFVARFRRIVEAHRWVWEQYVDAIPAGLSVLHHCDNKSCVNYEGHLFVGTQADNVKDMIAKQRNNPAFGERSNRTPLTPADVETIRMRASNGEGSTAIANDYPVNISSISRIILRKRWAHI